MAWFHRRRWIPAWAVCLFTVAFLGYRDGCSPNEVASSVNVPPSSERISELEPTDNEVTNDNNFPTSMSSMREERSLKRQRKHDQDFAVDVMGIWANTSTASNSTQDDSLAPTITPLNGAGTAPSGIEDRLKNSTKGASKTRSPSIKAPTVSRAPSTKKTKVPTNSKAPSSKGTFDPKSKAPSSNGTSVPKSKVPSSNGTSVPNSKAPSSKGKLGQNSKAPSSKGTNTSDITTAAINGIKRANETSDISSEAPSQSPTVLLSISILDTPVLSESQNLSDVQEPLGTQNISTVPSMSPSLDPNITSIVGLSGRSNGMGTVMEEPHVTGDNITIKVHHKRQKRERHQQTG